MTKTPNFLKYPNIVFGKGSNLISFDEIDCTQIIQDLAVYRHNFNGTGADIPDQFFGDMGCNGTIELKFATPVYLWLLENM
jgi:hypothetical protein